MSKIKMRCNTCGKWFQSANAKELTCPDCVQKARKEKLAQKNAPPSSARPAGQNVPPRPAPPPPPKPKPTQSGTSQWLDTVSDVKISQPEPPRPKLPPTPAPPRDNRGGPERAGPGTRGPGGQPGYREREGGNRGPGGYRESDYHGPAAYSVGSLSGTLGQRPRQPMEGGERRGPRPGGVGGPRFDRPRPGGPGGPREGRPGGQGPKAKAPKPPKPPTPPKPKKEKIPPPEPFKPTPEQVTQVEERYLELAVPSEFDGIRTQISKELNIPKSAVKKIVKELRDRQGIPSWWELQTYKGSSEELEKIKVLYEPLLPVPPIGIHKQIAEQLELKAGEVYQAIKAIRLEMNLPQYNDPALHGLEFPPPKAGNGQKKQDEQPVVTQAETTSTASEAATEATPVASVVNTEEAAGATVGGATEGEAREEATPAAVASESQTAEEAAPAAVVTEGEAKE
ncbi:MAG TPA: hypothetical protein VFA10_23200 [Ktedonobacteraceae bacterium]|nr:hypothetical protein [Ktedonobacteraceae bacterium]